MEKKYQIFISSTYEDLKDERKKVQDTILEMYQFPIGMEMFSAADEEQWEIIKETIDSSDYYVLIIGHRYGTVIEEGEYSGISYTQKEFRYALEQKIPVLAFLIDSSVPVILDNIEKDDTKNRKLNEFKNEVKTGRTVQWWTSTEDLASKVMNSLNKQISKGKRPGWARADGLNLEETQAELVEMSKNIRRLEEENKELRKSVIIRKPELILKVNNNTSLNVPYFEYDQSIIDCEYEKLTMDQIPEEAKNVISQEAINEYNLTLPSIEIIENFKSEMRFYQQMIDDPFKINFTIMNNGNMKANDIYVEITFPKDIVIYKKNRKNIYVPKKPTKGVNPLDKFYSEKNDTIYTDRYIFPNNRIPEMDLLGNLNSPRKHYINEDNSITIRMDNLMTGYSWKVNNEYILVPMNRGTFSIVARFICEEYENAEIQEIQVIVE